MRNRNLCQQFFAKGLTLQGFSLDCAVRYEPWRGSTVRLLGVSSLNSGRAHARPFFFAPGLLPGQHRMGDKLRQGRDLAIDRREIGTRCSEQLGEIVDHEIGLLVAEESWRKKEGPCVSTARV